MPEESTRKRIPLKPPATLILPVLMVATAALTLLVVTPAAWIDDAFISFRYARNLASGAGLVYNPGEAIEGYTNFLWTLLAFVGTRMGVEPIVFSQAIALLAQAATLAVVYALGDGPSGRRLLAPALLACNVSFLSYPMTGMETTLHSLLVCAAVLTLQRGVHTRPRGWIAAGLLLLAISLNRFDGFVLVGILVSYRLLVAGEWKASLRTGGLWGAGWVGYQLWRLAYYPTPLPNTFYAKMGFTPAQLVDGLKYLYAFAQDYQMLVPLVLVALFHEHRAGSRGSFLGWVAGWQLAYVVVVGGDWMPHFRFILHVLPLIYVLAQDGMWWAFDRLADTTGSLRKLQGAVAVGVIATLNVVPLYRGRGFVDEESFYSPRDAASIGRILDEALPRKAVVAMEWGGIAPYHMEQPVLELFGLADRDIVAHDFPASSLGREIDMPYLASRAPDVVVSCMRLFESPDEARRATAVEDVCDYRAYMSLVRDWGYEVCVFGDASRGYWPGIVREARRGSLSSSVDCSASTRQIASGEPGTPSGSIPGTR